MSKKHLKILEAFMSSELKNKLPQKTLQTNYNKDGKIESYSVVIFFCDPFTHKDKSVVVNGYNQLSYVEMLSKLTVNK